LRGAVFELGDWTGWYHPRDGHGDIAVKAMEDIAGWLGFASRLGYLNRLPREKRAIFKRAARSRPK
jgi:hypothetical protein